MSKKEVQPGEDGWDRFPEARIRMRENGLKTILDGLGEDGFCTASPPRIHFLDDGVYVDILLNVGKHGSIVALAFEVFIPCKMPASPKKKPAKEKKVNETKPAPVEPPVVLPVDELRNDEPQTSPDGPVGGSNPGV